jgi:hypothetical protein
MEVGIALASVVTVLFLLSAHPTMMAMEVTVGMLGYTLGTAQAGFSEEMT